MRRVVSLCLCPFYYLCVDSAGTWWRVPRKSPYPGKKAPPRKAGASEQKDAAREPRRAMAAGWPRSLSLTAKTFLPESHVDEPSKRARLALIPPLGESHSLPSNCLPAATATSQEPSHLVLNKTQSSPTHLAPPMFPVPPRIPPWTRGSSHQTSLSCTSQMWKWQLPASAALSDLF